MISPINPAVPTLTSSYIRAPNMLEATTTGPAILSIFPGLNADNYRTSNQLEACCILPDLTYCFRYDVAALFNLCFFLNQNVTTVVSTMIMKNNEYNEIGWKEVTISLG